MNPKQMFVFVSAVATLGGLLVSSADFQEASAKDLPEEASETGNKPNDCGGSNEVKIPFESEEEGGFGTDTGRLTGEFNSAENDRDDPSTHENWPPIPSECRNND